VDRQPPLALIQNMKTNTASHFATTGVLGLAAGAGYVGSSILTESSLDRAIAAGMTAALSVLLLPSTHESTGSTDSVIRLGSLTWNQEDFCRNWLITGRTGSGKTAAGIANIMAQLFALGPSRRGEARFADDDPLDHGGNDMILAPDRFAQGKLKLFQTVHVRSSHHQGVSRGWRVGLTADPAARSFVATAGS
jgi:hypothetical protein